MSRAQRKSNFYVDQRDAGARMGSIQRAITQLVASSLQVLNNLSDLNDPLAALRNLGIGGLSGAWQSYTPTWTASTTNPSIGNGSIVGRYLQIGKTCWFRAYLQFGTTTTAGSGNYSVGLPVASVTIASDQQYVSGVFAGSSAFDGVGVITVGSSACLPFFPTVSTSSAIARWSSSGLGTPSGGSCWIGGIYQTT